MEPKSMEEALKILTDSVRRCCGMEGTGEKNEERQEVNFELSLERRSAGERPEGKIDMGADSVEGQIDMGGFIEKTNENSLKMCLEGYIPSEKGGERTEADRFQVCLDVGEKLIACIKPANFDVVECSGQGSIRLG